MNEFERILKVFGQSLMAFLALFIGIVFLATLAPLMSDLTPILGAGFILIFIGIIVATISEIVHSKRR